MEIMPNENIGIIGLGQMGSAIAKGLQNEKKTVNGFDPFVKEAAGIRMFSSIPLLAGVSDVLIVAVKPNMVVPVLQELVDAKIIISIAAGISYDTLKKNSPIGSRVIRVMPNLALLASRGALAFYSEDEDAKIVLELFSSLGVSVRVSKETLMDAVTGLSGSGPAYVLSFLHAMTEAGLKEGLSFDEAQSLAMETIEGTMVYFRKLKETDPKVHPMEVRNRVTSPGGTTIHGLDALERGGFTMAVKDAVSKASERSRELGKG
ncbi:pyrroline-5-carboxylate reductase [Leptospira sp. 96542]|nr:pyrroline-5-carboxylate reductase [Leptospira sp. 96542]